MKSGAYGAAAGLPAQPFFLVGQTGERFCLYHPAQGTVRGALVYVHPFAEEMNKCRRMAAQQARNFARAGFAVLQIDLYGCGDSSGDFGDARWDIWLDDLQRAQQWLALQQSGPVGWWGMRLGALLALEAAGRFGGGPVLLWQPVISGEVFMTQFLRMRVATEVLAAAVVAGIAEEVPAVSAAASKSESTAESAEDLKAAKAASTQGMRAAMAGGETMEVGGYALAPAMAAAIDNLKLFRLAVPGLGVHWFEVVAEQGRALPPAAAVAATALREAGVDLHLHLAVGPAFWTTQEVVDCPALLTATSAFQELVLA
ncbi:MAG: hydrolase 2, exosortase A system-associated [Tardiphaga sp.]|uniref:hydrolase 2, exosortase A system-associated n=1 Tax=Tardiphaga sp. TaxID=1926292 RepID=UPI0019C64B81|nr:hydrolase 2, exosortase A system-associated [Tardiphaga sp.]MBC7584824.1 hydrolase 2, exosortase A system-associated [Tardiphaga sp.]